MKILKVILSILILGTTLPSQPPHAKPYVPENNSIIIEKLPTSRNSQIRELRERQEQLSRTPDNLPLAISVARAYVELGRTTADPRYDGYAQAVLQPWWNLEQPPVDVLLLRATLAQRQHDFDRALQDLDLVLRKQALQPQAWLYRATIYQVRGQYKKALRNCLPLLTLASTLTSTTCLANTKSLNGEATTSYQTLRKLLATDSNGSVQERVWAFTVLADIAVRLGKDTKADQYFQKALSLNKKDSYTLGAYSDFLLDKNQPEEVQELLKDHTRTDGLLLRLTLAEQQLNSPSLTEHIEMLHARFTANRMRNDSRHLREEARFYLHLLHQPRQALQLAQQNWQVQREPWDVRILLESAIQAQDKKKADPALKWLNTVNLEDVQLETLKEELS